MHKKSQFEQKNPSKVLKNDSSFQKLILFKKLSSCSNTNSPPVWMKGITLLLECKSNLKTEKDENPYENIFS